MEDSHLFLQIMFGGDCVRRRALTFLDPPLVSGPVPPKSPLPSMLAESGHRLGEGRRSEARPARDVG